MTLEGAINFNETENYTIYTMNSVTTGQYGVVMPKNIVGTLNMLVDLHMKDSFGAVSSGAKTKEQLIGEISEEYNKLKSKYTDGMLVIPMIDEAMFENAVINNDKQKMFDEVKKIGAITSELYKKLTESGVEKQKIDQKIIIVEKNQNDENFVSWLKEQMPNFVDGISYSELVGTETISNPFMSNNDIFGPAPVEAPKVETTPVETPKVETNLSETNTTINFGSVFDSPTPVTTNPVPEPVAPVVPEPVVSMPETPVQPEPVVPATPVVEEPKPVENANVDIFGIPTDVQGAPTSVTPVTANPTPESVEPVVPEPVVSVPETPVQPEPVTPTAPVVEEPKPVESAMLEGTIAFTPIPNHPNNPVEEATNAEDVDDSKGKSKGFANLIILLVILVGVTIASVELGKYLYSVYGA